MSRLRPARAIYSDPALALAEVPAFRLAEIDEMLASPDRALIWSQNPRWPEYVLDIELAALARFDPAAIVTLDEMTSRTFLTETAIVPSLVVLPDPSGCVPPQAAALLRERGFETVTVPDAGHAIHLDNAAGFLAAIDGWL